MERGKQCKRPSSATPDYTTHCHFEIQRGFICKNSDWQSCWSGPWVYEPCSFDKNGLIYKGECNKEGQCEGKASVEVKDDGAVDALEKCKKDDCSDYRGKVTVTVNGTTCQAWEAKKPHLHNRTPRRYPNAGLEGNYCRNPDGEDTIWCYTMDKDVLWEYCSPLAT